MKSYLIIAAVLFAGILAGCEAETEQTGEFRYKMGSNGNYRNGVTAELYGTDLIVRFANDDTLSLIFVTGINPSKSTYLFGVTYGVDSDIMVNKFENYEVEPHFLGVDSYKSGSLTITSWTDTKISGTFDFNCNTLNPDDLSSNVFNFQGEFQNVPVHN